MKLLMSLYQWLAVRKAQINLALFAAEIFLFGSYVAVIFFVTQNQGSMGIVIELGAKLGQISALLYIGTLLPGMMKRFGLINPVQLALMMFRRHIGILMFLSMLGHFLFSLTLPVVTLGLPPVLTPHLAMGWVSVLLLFPLWLTSNDFSVARLGKWWNTIHGFTYVAMLSITAHVALATSYKFAALLAVAVILEVLSFIVAWRRKQKKITVSSNSSI